MWVSETELRLPQAPLPTQSFEPYLPFPNPVLELVHKHRASLPADTPPSPMTIFFNNRYIYQVLKCNAIYTVKCFLNPSSYSILVTSP